MKQNLAIKDGSKWNDKRKTEQLIVLVYKSYANSNIFNVNSSLSSKVLINFTTGVITIL